MIETREYRAVCFDLDGTLLPMDIDEFMKAYFERIARYAASCGLDPGLFMKALKGGTQAMALSNDDRVNKDVFWEAFDDIYGRDNLAGFDANAMADRFYEEDFAHIGDGFVGNANVPRVLQTLVEKGYSLVLTTMPMFPLRAVQHRLGWAGADPGLFQRITTYENSKTTKPRQTYFAENLAAMGLRGEDVLVVGNNTMEDLSFLDLGADAYLVTDWLLDPVGFDLGTVRHGSFAEFADWACGLPSCKNPATGISNDVVSLEDMKAAFHENAVRDLTIEEADEKARLLAKAIRDDKPLGKR